MSRAKKRTTLETANGRTSIAALIGLLASADDQMRVAARSSLVELGRQASSALMEALPNANQTLRSELAKALTDIGDPRAAPALPALLDDDDPGVRWVAAEGLATMGCDGVVAVLQMIGDHADSPWVREGAHYVLSHMAKTALGPVVAPVLAALEDLEPDLVAPPVAFAALQRIDSENLCSGGLSPRGKKRPLVLH